MRHGAGHVDAPRRAAQHSTFARLAAAVGRWANRAAATRQRAGDVFATTPCWPWRSRGLCSRNDPVGPLFRAGSGAARAGLERRAAVVLPRPLFEPGRGRPSVGRLSRQQGCAHATARRPARLLLSGHCFVTWALLCLASPAAQGGRMHATGGPQALFVTCHPRGRWPAAWPCLASACQVEQTNERREEGLRFAKEFGFKYLVGQF